jgi:hypothetical protein
MLLGYITLLIVVGEENDKGVVKQNDYENPFEKEDREIEEIKTYCKSYIPLFATPLLVYVCQQYEKLYSKINKNKISNDFSNLTKKFYDNMCMKIIFFSFFFVHITDVSCL